MISGKYYADKCKWVECSRYPDRPRYSKLHARTGDWVFINGDHVFAFAASMPRIMPKKHSFVVHNSDQSFDSRKLAALLPFALSIHAANTTVVHPILTTIPLGFPDRAVPSRCHTSVQTSRGTSISMQTLPYQRTWANVMSVWLHLQEIQE